MAKNLAGTTLPAGNGGTTYPSAMEWPITVFAVTAITQSPQATVTAPAHGITLTNNESTPRVEFSQVKGMQGINGQFGFVVNVIDVNNIQIALNTSNYSPYISGGFINVTGTNAPIDPLTNTFP